MENEELAKKALAQMTSELSEALGYIKLIEDEEEINGTDSLANIDYGAELNTRLIKARSLFQVLDNMGMFTAGQID